MCASKTMKNNYTCKDNIRMGTILLLGEGVNVPYFVANLAEDCNLRGEGEGGGSNLELSAENFLSVLSICYSFRFL